MGQLTPDLSTPLCVDLDGTLILTDLFWSSVRRYLAGNPLRIFQLAAWLLRGRPYAKGRLVETCPVDPAALPYHEEMLALLREEKRRGRPLMLATASHREHARKIAAHLNLFDHFIGTEGGGKNLSGKWKLSAMRDWLGGRPFIYAGNSAADLPIWQGADFGIVVQADDSVRRRAEELTQVLVTF